MGGAVSGVAPVVSNNAPSSAPSTAPAAGGKSSPAGSNDYANAYSNAGSIGGGLNVAQYDPNAAPQGMMGGKGPARSVTPYAAPAAQPASPIVQQMQQPGQAIRGIGPGQFPALQSLLNSLAGGYGMGQQAYSPMPAYQSQALNYRPNLGMVQQNLNRTATTRAEADAAAAERAKQQMLASVQGDGISDTSDFDRWQRQQYQNYLMMQNSTGGG